MFAALNSESCIRRSTSGINFNPNVFCDPLGDRNIHWPVGPMTDNVKNVIMVIARLDANSLYENLVPGAGSTVTGLVTLLATATYLHSLNATVNSKKHGHPNFCIQIDIAITNPNISFRYKRSVFIIERRINGLHRVQQISL